MPLVLVHNEVVSPEYQWDDVEGIHYHYPTKYRGKVRVGEPFVYYRGVHRINDKRGPAEYVGAGSVGDIWADPSRKGAWYCRVDNYERFASPVLAKVDGVNREKIPRNRWRDGVRVLDPQVYDDIMREAKAGITAKASRTIPAEEAQIPKPGDLILPPALAKHHGKGSGDRRSPRSKAIGDWAEQAALAYIKSQIAGCSECTHRAALGETPGWDIDYRDAHGVLQRVEVKGTVLGAFAGVELTANEMKAAEAHMDEYWLCLIARCETDQPSIQLIQNPFWKMSSGQWSASSAIYSVRFNAAADPLQTNEAA